MAGLTTVANLRLVAEDDDLLAANMLDHFGTHDCPSNARRADSRRDVIVASDQQYPFEIERLAWFTGQSLDGERISWFDAVLLSARLDNCVHRSLRWLPASRCRA